ncbi:ABC transporter substrate-binding protein [Desertibacillus haloalkaliphilus]|nr:ABC transporter substrate-binding protein [Desertibacillus haloalkaliphilus]
MLLIVGCSSANETVGEDHKQIGSEHIEGSTIVEIENNGNVLTFTEVPERAVTLNQHVTEVMLALGLEDHMVGMAYLDDEILPRFQEAYQQIPILADQYPSQEVFLSVEADFAYAGWESAFREDSIGTVEQLNEFGVHAYLHESSRIVGPTFEDVYEDIRNIGRIFRVEDRADTLIAEMDEEINQLRERIDEEGEPLRVFVYDSGEQAPFTSARNFLNTLIEVAGAKNIFNDVEKNWAEVSWEEVVDRDPEVIVIVDYGETTVDQKREHLLHHPALKDVTAIKNEHFIIIPLSAAAEGIRAPAALELLVDGLYNN